MCDSSKFFFLEFVQFAVLHACVIGEACMKCCVATSCVGELYMVSLLPLCNTDYIFFCLYFVINIARWSGKSVCVKSLKLSD